MVPGLGGSTGGLDVLARRLEAGGRDVTVISLPGDGTGDLREQAQALDQAVDAALGCCVPMRAVAASLTAA